MSSEEVRATTAAKRLGVSAQRVSELKYRGLLCGRHGYVTTESLERYMIANKNKVKDKYIKPTVYTKEERKRLRKVKGTFGPDRLLNHHYIV